MPALALHSRAAPSVGGITAQSVQPQGEIPEEGRTEKNCFCFVSGRQVITYLLICNLTMWIIYTFEVQKVQDSPVQVKMKYLFRLG